MAAATGEPGLNQPGAMSISVIIPTFNRLHTLPAAIDSALAQTHPRVEVVVVDDGSTDDTDALLRSYDDRLCVLTQPNAGVAAARNAGVAASTGEVVMFLDSDDTLLPDAAAIHAEALTRAPSAIASFGDMTMVSRTGWSTSLIEERKLRPTRSDGVWTNVQDVVATRFVYTNQTVAFRRSSTRQVGGFDEGLWVMEDFDFALRLSAHGPWAFTSRPVAVRQEGAEGSLTDLASADSTRLDETIELICARALAEGTLTSDVAQRAVSRMHRRARRRVAARSSARPAAMAFLDEEVGERIYRNTPMFPRAEVQPFGAPLAGSP